eukprot:UN04719
MKTFIDWVKKRGFKKSKLIKSSDLRQQYCGYFYFLLLTQKGS